jgi:cysteine synthase B
VSQHPYRLDSSVVAAIGNTPLVRLSSVERDVPGLELYGKLEASNPGGSVKDRAGRHMVLEGIRSGALTPGKRLLDATSGNTGIAYAMLGAALGFPVTLCLPSSASPERKRILAAYGAELVFTDPMDGSDGAIVEARRRHAASPDTWFYPDQYNNDFNWRAHFETTGPEILRDTAARITHFVAALGTSGTFMGTGRYLRAHLPEVTLISVQPESPLHGLEGLKHMASAIVPGIYDETLADHAAEVSTEDAHEMTRRLAREEGLLVGVSSGANLAAALKHAALARASRDHVVMVAILCDAGDRYLSEHFWDEGRVAAAVSGAREAR